MNTSPYVDKPLRTQSQALADLDARYLSVFSEKSGEPFCEQMGFKTLAEAIEDIRDCTFEYRESIARMPDGSWHGVDLSDLVTEAELDEQAEAEYEEQTHSDYYAGLGVTS